MSELLVFCNSANSRTTYIVDVIIGHFLSLPYKITSSLDEFTASENPKITYLSNSIHGYFNIPNTGFLDEPFHFDNSKITAILDNIEATLKVEQNSTIQFDIFSLCFYFLARIEEYGNYTPDLHGRFSSTASLLHQKNLCAEPVVDIWTTQLKNFLQFHFPYLDFPKNGHNLLLTFDIDIAWAYKGKPFIRHYGNYFRDLFTFNFSRFAERQAVIAGRKTDPFDVYDYLENVQQETNLNLLFFFQLRSKGKYDKSVSYKSKEFKQLLKKLSRFAAIGLHPSYFAGQTSKYILEEKQILEDIIGKPVTKSRQHFLKFHIPTTPQALVESGITDDYTLGFADAICWRAGSTRSFPFFDISQDKGLPIHLHPISFMDGTLLEYLGLEHQTAINIINQIFQTTQFHQGEFIPLWHNETISNHGKWNGWKEEVFEQMLALINDKKQ